MAGRKPGPPPVEGRQRRNADPMVGKDGWVEIEPTPNDGYIPEIPEEILTADSQIQAIYEYLMKLPQARLYGPGTVFQLWMALPLIKKYLDPENDKGPSVEAYKAIVSTLGSALRLTEDDLAKSRVKMKHADEHEESETAQGNEKVISIKARRDRLGG